MKALEFEPLRWSGGFAGRHARKLRGKTAEQRQAKAGEPRSFRGWNQLDGWLRQVEAPERAACRVE